MAKPGQDYDDEVGRSEVGLVIVRKNIVERALRTRVKQRRGKSQGRRTGSLGE